MLQAHSQILKGTQAMQKGNPVTHKQENTFLISHKTLYTHWRI